MWIVKLALRRPYTFVVMALLILLLGVTSIRNTPTDIFPEIDIPVVTVVWQYTGLSPDQMAKQITTFSEYTISSAVDNVKNIESQSLAGVSVIRIFFQPNVRIDAAIAQVTAVSQTILRRMPPGAQPPFIIRYNASSVPILQLALGSKTLTRSATLRLRHLPRSPGYRPGPWCDASACPTAANPGKSWSISTRKHCLQKVSRRSMSATLSTHKT